MMEFKVTTLQDLSAIKVAVEVCNHPDVKKEILCAAPGSENFDHWSNIGKWEDTVLERAKIILEDSGLSKQLQGKIASVIKPMGRRMLHWAKYHENYFHVSRSSCVEFLNGSVFTSWGLIDNRMAAEKLVNDERLGLFERFCLACVYFPKKEHLGKKSSRKKWKQLAKNAFSSSSNRKENGLMLECPISGHSTLENVDPHDLTLLQLLALNALELTAPASDILLKNRSNNWFQLSGHEGSFAPAGPGTIWKKRPADETEVKAYKQLMDDTMADVVPKFYRDIEYQGEHFIELQDLLYKFKNPSVMDIKMGTRTFLESEVTNSTSRPDLYQKMIKINPSAPTEEEQLSQSITKLRYMQFRENLSSSSSFGFRIEGFKVEGQEPTKDFALVSSKEDITNTMQMFVGMHENVRIQLIERLKELRTQLEKSKFFRTHEVIGSSLLIIHDGNTSGIWMIDFAKSVPTKDGTEVDHRSPWVLGNHEDGFLFGLDNLILILKECSTKPADQRT